MTSKDKSRPSRSRRRAAEAPAPAGAADLSRIVEVDEVPDAGLQIAIQADAAERAAIAKRAGLVAVELLKADLEIAKEGEAKFGVVGALRARIVQTCVVTPRTLRERNQRRGRCGFCGRGQEERAAAGQGAGHGGGRRPLAVFRGAARRAGPDRRRAHGCRRPRRGIPYPQPRSLSAQAWRSFRRRRIFEQSGCGRIAFFGVEKAQRRGMTAPSALTRRKPRKRY